MSPVKALSINKISVDSAYIENKSSQRIKTTERLENEPSSKYVPSDMQPSQDVQSMLTEDIQTSKANQNMEIAFEKKKSSQHIVDTQKSIVSPALPPSIAKASIDSIIMDNKSSKKIISIDRFENEPAQNKSNVNMHSTIMPDVTIEKV